MAYLAQNEIGKIIDNIGYGNFDIDGFHCVAEFIMEWLEEYPDDHWDMDSIINSPKLTLEFVKRYINKDWCLESLILNPGLSTKDKIWLCEKID